MNEVLPFLDSSNRQDVRLEASKIVASMAASHHEFFLASPDSLAILLNLIQEKDVQVQHQILTALINLTSNLEIVDLMSLPQVIYNVIIEIVLPKSLVSDLCCMLLNNLSKSKRTIEILLDSKTHIDNLIEVFCRGDGASGTGKFNKNASYHFLGGVFANVSSSISGAEHLLAKSTIVGFNC